MATRYAVAGSSLLWHDTGMWSTTNSGAGGASVPTTGDTADINGQAVTLDVNSITPAIIQDVAGGGTLTPNAGTYTIGTVANPTTITASSVNTFGLLTVQDNTNVTVTGQILNNVAGTSSNAIVTVVLTNGTNGTTSTLTINAVSGSPAVINNAPRDALSVTDETPCAVVCNGSGMDNTPSTPAVKLTINGDVVNKGKASGVANGPCAAWLNNSGIMTINGNAINGDSTGADHTLGLNANAVSLTASGTSGSTLSTIINGNATNYGNGGRPVGIIGSAGDSHGLVTKIVGNWANNDTSVGSGTPNGAVTGWGQALLLIYGDVSGPAGCKCFDDTSGGPIVVLGRFLGDTTVLSANTGSTTNNTSSLFRQIAIASGGIGANAVKAMIKRGYQVSPDGAKVTPSLVNVRRVLQSWLLNN